jgi:hypothetical protein
VPRSERGRIRGDCLHRIALLSLAQAPVAGGGPGAARAARRRAVVGAGASRRTGLSPSGDPLGRAWASGRKPSASLSGPWRGHRRATRPTWKTIGARPAARLLRAVRPAGARLASADSSRPLDWGCGTRLSWEPGAGEGGQRRSEKGITIRGPERTDSRRFQGGACGRLRREWSSPLPTRTMRDQFDRSRFPGRFALMTADITPNCAVEHDDRQICT